MDKTDRTERSGEGGETAPKLKPGMPAYPGREEIRGMMGLLGEGRQLALLPAGRKLLAKLVIQMADDNPDTDPRLLGRYERLLFHMFRMPNMKAPGREIDFKTFRNALTKRKAKKGD